MSLREDFEKETNKHCPEMSYNFLDYYHYEIAYSEWLENKIRKLQTLDNSEYIQCKIKRKATPLKPISDE